MAPGLKASRKDKQSNFEIMTIQHEAGEKKSEKEIIKQQLKDSGKPDNILEKMMEGKLKKFFEENTLLGQNYVIDPTITVEEYINHNSEKNNTTITVKDFIRYEIGS